MGLSAFYSTLNDYSEDEKIEFLNQAYNLNCRFWDTAQIYKSPVSDNQELIGKFFEKYPETRKDVILCTKTGINVSEDGTRTFDNSAAFIRASCLESLEKLKTT